MSSTVTYTRETPQDAAQTLKIERSETLEEMVDRVALSHGIATTTLFNLVESESQFNPNAVGKHGEVGLVQIMPDWGFTEEQMLDPEFSLNFAAEKIANGEEYYWTPCSCVSYVRARMGLLPRGDAEDFFPTNQVPKKNSAVILKYWDPVRYHLAYVEWIGADGLHIAEANFEPCKVTRRVIPIDSKNIMGYKDYIE